MEKGFVEVTRSFSFKVNLGNYENVDFFCSQKAECEGRRAEEVSLQLYDFCKRQVMRDVNNYKRERDELKNGTARRFERKGISMDNAEHDAGNGILDFGQ